MELRPSGEDYLEAVLILGRRTGTVHSIDVARYLNFSKPSVSHGLRLLREGGFLTMERNGSLHLTEVGIEAAEKIYERHCFFTRWLISAGIDPETAERDACRMEHAISEDSFRKLMDALDGSGGQTSVQNHNT